MKRKERPGFNLDCLSRSTKVLEYNSVYDKNLYSYFTNMNIIKHLKKTGILTKKG